MKKTLIIASLVVISGVILFQSGVFDSLALFLLAGIVPGTTYAVPSTFMLLLMTSIAWIAILSLVPFESLHKTATKKQRTPRKQLPRRRYSQL